MKLGILLTVIAILSFPNVAYARKILPRAIGGSASTAPRSPSTGTKGVTTSVKFRSDRRAVLVSFSNLAIAKRVDYTLSYNTRGTTQGASGSILIPASDPQIRELIFGTCSHGVCRYDSELTNAKLTVTTYLTSGKKVIKSFRLKV